MCHCLARPAVGMLVSSGPVSSGIDDTLLSLLSARQITARPAMIRLASPVMITNPNTIDLC
jgi:hypothetical protein